MTRPAYPIPGKLLTSTDLSPSLNRQAVLQQMRLGKRVQWLTTLLMVLIAASFLMSGSAVQAGAGSHSRRIRHGRRYSRRGRRAYHHGRRFARRRASRFRDSSLRNARGAEASLFLTRLPTAAEAAHCDTHAKYEPSMGCYLGAFIDFDSTLQRPFKDQNGIRHQDPAAFESIVGKSHAMYFFYLGYGRRLPLDWVRSLAMRNKLVHIALEPNSGLDQVRDNAYLEQLAADMKRSGARIFLRFASEMNGPWTNYHRVPAEYRAKFRLVHDVMKRKAPNVAMVWCPYMEPSYLIPRYYPGDDATDWVGVNMYNVTYHNNQRDKPSEFEHPSDMLKFVYSHYAARKPMMICEYGATHRSEVEGKPRPDFAIRKIMTLYAALPRLYPRVKCINYFDGNALEFASNRAYNDYSVTDEANVTATYRYAIASPYYLSETPPPDADPPPVMPMPLVNGQHVRGRVRFSCWARAPSDSTTVRYFIDGKRIYTASRPDTWDWLCKTNQLGHGKHRIGLQVLRGDGAIVARKSITIFVDG